MARLTLYFTLLTVTLLLLDFTSAAPNEAALRLKRSPQMPEMPAPPGGFPNPPSPPFKRIVRQSPEDVPKEPPSEFLPMDARSVHPQTRTQRHLMGSEQMKHAVQDRSSKVVHYRLKREARGTGGKFPNRGG